MAKKDLDWGNIGFSYRVTDKRYVSNWKDGNWDEGALISDPNVQRTGGNGDDQHDYGGKNAFFHKEVKSIIGIGKSKIHRENADDCRNDPVAISMGFQRNQKHAENKDHGNQRLRGKELLNQQIDGKGTAKNKDRKQSILLSLSILHHASPEIYCGIIRHVFRFRAKPGRKTA